MKNFLGNLLNHSGRKKRFIKLDLQKKGKVYYKYSIETSPDLDKYFKSKTHYEKILPGGGKYPMFQKAYSFYQS